MALRLARRREERAARRARRKLNPPAEPRATALTLDRAMADVARRLALEQTTREAAAAAAAESSSSSSSKAQEVREGIGRCARLPRSIADENRVLLLEEEEEEEERPLRMRGGADCSREKKESCVAGEILEFLRHETPARQVALLEFSLRKENMGDLPLIARAFERRYPHGCPFDDEVMVARLVCEVREAHVSRVEAPATLLRLLVRRPSNLRRALKCGAPGIAARRAARIALTRAHESKGPALRGLHDLVAALILR